MARGKFSRRAADFPSFSNVVSSPQDHNSCPYCKTKVTASP